MSGATDTNDNKQNLTKRKSGIKSKMMVRDYTPGLILFPSFACPALVGEDSMLSILVLGKKGKPITSEKVNIHLKILPWNQIIGEIKHHMLESDISTFEVFSKPLFADPNVAESNIECSAATSLVEIVEDTQGRFALILEKKVLETYKDYGYTELYRVDIHLTYLCGEGYHNLFWINRCAKEGDTDSKGNLMIRDREEEDDIIQRKMNHFFGKKIYKSDYGITYWFDSSGRKLAWRQNWYGFAVETRSLFFDKLQPRYPICSYHPVLYKKKSHYNIAHMADLHLVSRLTLMRRSEAKVIESEDIPTVGSMLNDHFETVYDLFEQAGSDKEIDMVLISGDVVDYIKSFYPVEFVDKKNELLDKHEIEFANRLKLGDFYKTVGSIWKAVGVDSKGESAKKYQDCVDLITIYSIILNFYQRYGKPVFLVSGNHDTYYWPYGVSPRILGTRANAGIPADMNLTTYEAILSYGSKYKKVIRVAKFRDLAKSIINPSGIEKGMFNVFYSLFTPIKDFALVLPNFTLIGLSWGEDEDIIDLAGKQAPTHLPRSDEAISDDQMKLVEFALQKNRTNILFSHFTFVSYSDGKPRTSSEEGDVEFDWAWDPGKCDMGTFEKNRKKIYERYLAKEKKLHYVLTGHSHRRGLYRITRVDYSGDNSVKTRFYDFPAYVMMTLDKTPKIIVSDSAGPIPRYNNNGEFEGWGSSIPSFTKIILQSNGNLRNLEAVASKNPGAKPRFAVAMDYLYIVKGYDMIKSFESWFLLKKHYSRATSFKFNLRLNVHDKTPYDIERIAIYFHCDGKFHRVPVSCGKREGNLVPCEVIFKDVVLAQKFKDYAVNRSTRTVFASVKFKRNSGYGFSQYNYDSPYNFEIEIKKRERDELLSSENIYLDISRKKKNNEYPNLKWKRRYYNHKYGDGK